MSVTKMVVAAVVAASLCADDRAALDVPVTRWLPEWKDDERSTISLRMLIGHRSGLRSIPASDVTEVPDAFAAALDLPLEGQPTEAFVYNNLAFNLLGGIVRREFGASIAEVADRVLFRPLSVTQWDWKADEAGSPRCHFGLSCRAGDLAKIGRVYVDGAGVAPDWWPHRAVTSGLSCYPQMTWLGARISPALAATWREAGIDAALVDRCEPLLDRELDLDDFFDELEKAFDGAAHVLVNQVRIRGLKTWDGASGPIAGYGHDGSGGQYLVVYPDADAVAVRLREDLAHGAMWTSFPGDARDVVQPGGVRRR
jgi:CubicO group peptidase (beta-lactamase class C family)